MTVKLAGSGESRRQGGTCILASVQTSVGTTGEGEFLVPWQGGRAVHQGRTGPSPWSQAQATPQKACPAEGPPPTCLLWSLRSATLPHSDAGLLQKMGKIQASLAKSTVHTEARLPSRTELAR